MYQKANTYNRTEDIKRVEKPENEIKELNYELRDKYYEKFDLVDWPQWREDFKRKFFEHSSDTVYLDDDFEEKIYLLYKSGLKPDEAVNNYVSLSGKIKNEKRRKRSIFNRTTNIS